MDIIPKRPWAHGDIDRRQKDGTREDRKNLADALRAGKHIQTREESYHVPAFILITCLLIAGLMLLVFIGKAHAYTQEEEIKAIIGEAEGEPQTGRVAVACAINNRRSLQGVYGLHAYRVTHKLYTNMVYNDVIRDIKIAEDKNYCDDLIHGAQYWEGTNFKTPYWARKMKLTAIIGHQRFYREDK